MTNQEIFDRVLTHLRKQGHASIDAAGKCAYRSENGDMCAIGCLIPDALYTPEMEGDSVGYVLDTNAALAALLGPGHGASCGLLESLQDAHDHYLVFSLSQFEHCMEEIANTYNLAYTLPINGVNPSLFSIISTQGTYHG